VQRQTWHGTAMCFSEHRESSSNANALSRLIGRTADFRNTHSATQILKRRVALAAEWVAKSMTQRGARKSILIFTTLCLPAERHTVELQALVWQANLITSFSRCAC
jgi:hypothetical protein